MDDRAAAPPQLMRVVSLTCSNTEILHAVGAGHLLVGVDDHSDWPVALVDPLPRLGPDLQIDLDALEALEPDLVLASLTVPGHEKVVEGLEARGLPFLAPAPESLADVARDLRELGAAVGFASQGENAAQAFEAAMVPRTSTGVVCSVEWWPRPVYVPGRRSWVTEMIELAGGISPTAHENALSLPLTAEAAQEIEAVVISWCGVPFEKYRPEIVLQRPGWENVPAVLHDQIHCVPEAFLGRPGPRLVQGLEALASVIDACESRRTSGTGP